MGGRRGFTLVELLVVIGILAVLAAIVFPVFSRAREKARAATCLSNLKQLGLAVAMYCQDYDSKFPWGLDPADWYLPLIWSGYPQWQALIPTMQYLHEVVNPYVRNRQVWACPSDSGYTQLEDSGLALNAQPSAYEAFGTSYMWRTEVCFSQATLESLRDPVGTNLLFDGHGAWHGWGLGYTQKRWNILFGDLHVKSADRTLYDKAWMTLIP